jgi:hypothetical protein
MTRLAPAILQDPGAVPRHMARSTSESEPRIQRGSLAYTPNEMPRQ